MTPLESSVFSRTGRLVGADGMKRLQEATVILFGVGGVGSWCAEALVRSGIRKLTLVDSDRVSITNVNRQLMATTLTVGQVKVDALRTRLLEINPDAEITAIQSVYSKETAGSFGLEQFDYIIDAIDSLKDKSALLLHASSMPGKLFSSMGAACKADPTGVKVAEFWNVRGCPLGAAIRKKYRKAGTLPAKKFLCVYDEEVLPNLGPEPGSSDDAWSSTKAVINGTLAHITGIFGFTLAGLVIQDILGRRP
ncbi:MAG: tRNA threonylcarbamoyladenosine dehydratase [Bacteroidales bacterium]|nr:tRNA threonylcarbamoyladenosine dehydratase [Bacteroidales bacterium]